MKTPFLDTGEAFLSPADKRFVRVGFVPAPIAHDPRFRLTPPLTALALSVAVGALLLAAATV